MWSLCLALSLRIIISRLIHFVAYITTSFLFMNPHFLEILINEMKIYTMESKVNTEIWIMVISGMEKRGRSNG